MKVPVPSPPHVVTHYQTHWNTVVDQTYDPWRYNNKTEQQVETISRLKQGVSWLWGNISCRDFWILLWTRRVLTSFCLFYPTSFHYLGSLKFPFFFYMTSEDCQNGLSDWHSLWSHSKYLWPQKNDVFGVSRGRVKSACTRHP